MRAVKTALVDCVDQTAAIVQRRTGVVAEGAADCVERALDIATQRRAPEQLHECGGAIDIHGAEGRKPLAHCRGCGQGQNTGRSRHDTDAE
ncbi:hypothetical protein [Streptomyces formicae]